MHLLKYTDGWTRRHFLEHSAKGIMAAGLLAPVLHVLADTGTCDAAYPPELLSIDAYTKGKLKAGQELNADNVDLVKDILNPGLYYQIKNEKRVCDLAPTETRMDHLIAPPFFEATLHNKGKYQFGPDGNLWTKNHEPWQGGNPFPEPQKAEEVLVANTLSWSRHDCFGHAIWQWDTDAAGEVQYTYSAYAVEFQTVGRTVIDPKPYQTGYSNDLRLFSDLIVYPEDVEGTAFLQFWNYDQSKFPEFYGYTPQLKRTRTFPTDQRFEPLLPGDIFFASDVWMLGDPLLTWGDFKMVGKGPLLATAGHGRDGINKDWYFPLIGGSSGHKYFRTSLELIPETYICELSPTHFPRAPYSKKRVWYDARTQVPVSMLTFDRAGKPWHYKELNYGFWEPTPGINWPASLPKQGFWNISSDQNEDLQTNRMVHLSWHPTSAGGYQPKLNEESLMEYCSLSALRRLGR